MSKKTIFREIECIFVSINKVFFVKMLIIFLILISFFLSFSFSTPSCNDGVCIQAFNSSTTWNVPYGVTQVDVLLVGGGGGGGANTAFSNAGGGAGGAGGLIFIENHSIDFTVPQSITIGGGGAGVNAEGVPGQNGGDTIAFGLTALGGGGGILTSAQNTNPANDGGSGGGGRDNNRAFALQPSSPWGGFGNDGARNFNDLGGAGGGGAGTQPPDIDDDDGGAGGEGLFFGDIFGTQFGDNGWFAGGGGGGGRQGAIGIGGIGGGGNGSSQRDLIVPTNGLPNTGGGGGGGSSAHAGADGGSGVVIIRFQDPPNDISIEEQPQNTISGSPINPSPQILLESLFNEIGVSNFDIEVDLIGGTFEIGSTTTATTNSNGIASFNNLQITNPGTYTLNFSVVGLEDIWIESNSFTISTSSTPPTNLTTGPIEQCSDTFSILEGGTRYIIYVCDEVGSLDFTIPPTIDEVEVLLVGGGGGGAGATGNAGRGGGGAGGFVQNFLSVIPNTNYTITVGAGGLGGNAGSGQNGQNTAFDTLLVALGGGGGGNLGSGGQDGGSGGGSGVNNVVGLTGGAGLQPGSSSGGFGNSGGNTGPFAVGAGGGGGGGAGGAGGNGAAGQGGAGGSGRASSITGTSVTYAGGGGSSGGTSGGAGGSGGGGAGSTDGADVGQDGVDGLGGGGGGTQGATSTGIGGRGGSGVAIIRHEDIPASIQIIQQPQNSTNNLNINPSPSIRVRGLLGDNLQGVEVEVILNSSDFTGSSTTTIFTDSNGLATFNNLQINDLGTYNITFNIVNSPLSIVSNSFIIYDSQPPIIDIISPSNNVLYYQNEIEINFNATSLNQIDELFYFDGVDNITYLQSFNITLALGSYEFIFYSRDNFDQLSQEIIEFEIRELPSITILNPANNTKFLFNSTFEIEWEFTSLYSETLTCNIYINGDFFDSQSCSQTSVNSFELNPIGLSTSQFNITIEAELPSNSIPQAINSSTISSRGIQNTHFQIRKTIENVNNNLYQTFIEVENQIEDQDKSIRIFEFINQNINVGSISPPFTSLITSVIGSLFRGDLYIFNISLTSSEPEELITNVFTFNNNENSTLLSQYIIGFGGSGSNISAGTSEFEGGGSGGGDPPAVYDCDPGECTSNYAIYAISGFTWMEFPLSLIGAISSTNGFSNTEMIVNSGNNNPAAQACWDYEVDGFDDWYLPAIDQLDEIESESAGLTDFNFFTQYWSSTEIDANNANYYEQGIIRSGSKFASYNVLCIRDLN